jgi:serpin B
MAAAAAAAALAGVGCGSAKVSPSTRPTSTTSTTAAAEPASMSAVDAHTAFTLDLYRAMAAHGDGNLVASPHGADVVLSMILAGARGQTADEIRAALHQQPNGVADIAALEKTLRTRSHDAVTVELASSEWLEKTFAVRPEYRTLVEQTFGATTHGVDFRNSPQRATDAINADVAKATHGHIAKLLSDEIDRATRLVLVSTAYLDARWALPFEKSDTQPAEFTRADGSTAQRPTMRHTEDYATAHGQGWRAVSLPYSGNELSMLVVVPDDMTAFERTIDGAKLNAIASAAAGDPHPVDLSIPKFEFRTHGSLTAPLQSLGIRVAFTDAADLTGIAPMLTVSDVVQEAWVQVDELGTKAAAATAGMMMAAGAPYQPTPPERFAVDHPFLFAIRDNATGAVLFLGRVTDP